MIYFAKVAIPTTMVTDANSREMAEIQVKEQVAMEKMIDPKDVTILSIHTKETPEEKCILDSARGRFIRGEVIRIAYDNGFKLKTSDLDHIHVGAEYHTELAEEAEEYLNIHCAPDGFIFGYNDNGDWGLWKLDADE